MNEQRIDNLISQVIDGDITDAQWSELVSLAENTPRIWRDLAESQRDQQVLGRAMNDAVAVAEHVAAPVEQLEILRQTEIETLRPASRAAAWSGWAVAALVALAAIGNRMNLQAPYPANTAGIMPTFNSPNEAFDEYLRLGQESGDVLGEIPTRIIVSSLKIPTGEGYEVVYLRQILEVQVVPDLYEIVGQDEQGQPMLIQYQPKPRGM